MENYNVLVLMEKDKTTGFFTDTIDSYTVQSGLELVESIYLLEEEAGNFVYLTLTTPDVEDWQYYGIYDLYDEDIYQTADVVLLDGSGEYNPRWILKLGYIEDRPVMEERINKLIELHQAELSRVQPLVDADQQKYVDMSNEEE